MYSYREIPNIPVPFRKFMCQCLPYNTGIEPHDKWRDWVCKVCKKLPRHQLRECVVCDEIFILDFRHPFNCSLDIRCWSCISADPTRNCEHVLPRVYDLIGLKPPYLPPLRVFKLEQLDTFKF